MTTVAVAVVVLVLHASCGARTTEVGVGRSSSRRRSRRSSVVEFVVAAVVVVEVVFIVVVVVVGIVVVAAAAAVAVAAAVSVAVAIVLAVVAAAAAAATATATTATTQQTHTHNKKHSCCYCCCYEDNDCHHRAVEAVEHKQQHTETSIQIKLAHPSQAFTSHVFAPNPQNHTVRPHATVEQFHKLLVTVLQHVSTASASPTATAPLSEDLQPCRQRGHACVL